VAGGLTNNGSPASLAASLAAFKLAKDWMSVWNPFLDFIM
jgi:hypothetical protein